MREIANTNSISIYILTWNQFLYNIILIKVFIICTYVLWDKDDHWISIRLLMKSWIRSKSKQTKRRVSQEKKLLFVFQLLKKHKTKKSRIYNLTVFFGRSSNIFRAKPRMIARFARKTETPGRAKRKGVGGKEFLPALAFRRRISCQRSWRAAFNFVKFYLTT